MEMPPLISQKVASGEWTLQEAEYSWGYFDGRRPVTSEPDHTASPRYIHSFRIGRAEIEFKHLPSTDELRKKAAFIEAMLSDCIGA